MPDLMFIIWCAGFFDGEGSVMITKSSPIHHQLRAKITQKNRDTLGLIRGVFGGKIYSKGNRRRSVSVDLIMNGDVAVDFLRRIEPYVIVKKHHIAIALKFTDIRKSLRGKKLSQDEIDARNVARGELLALGKAYAPSLVEMQGIARVAQLVEAQP